MKFWRGWSERFGSPSRPELGNLITLLILAVGFCPIIVPEAAGADTSEEEVQPHNLGQSSHSYCPLSAKAISREANGLKGAVQAVLEKRAFFLGHGQQKKEGPSELIGLTFYDRFGTRIDFIQGCSRLKGNHGAVPDYCNYSIAHDDLGRVGSIGVIDAYSTNDPLNRPPLQTTRLTFSYDTQSNLTKWSKVYYDGSVSSSEVKYDSDGRVTEIKADEKNATFFRYGPNKKLLFTQTVDSFGPGGHGPRRIGIYNDYGNAVELIEDNLFFGGSFNRCFSTYDSNGNLVGDEWNYVSQDSGYSSHNSAFRWHNNKLTDQFVAEHIEHDVATETDAYDRNGNLIVSTRNQGLIDHPLWVKSVFAYEFDSVGNWVKRTISGGLSDDSSSSPHLVDYREIIYY